jgi:hypothetical protein
MYHLAVWICGKTPFKARAHIPPVAAPDSSTLRVENLCTVSIAGSALCEISTPRLDTGVRLLSLRHVGECAF